MTQIADIDNTGFPPGYFIIRSVASDRVLDVVEERIADGTDIILWPEKDKTLVDSVRGPVTDNQVFFIDPSGALCSRPSGNAIDVEDESLVLRHRRPIYLPFPNKYAHPLPSFTYLSETGEISVQFACDPSFPSFGGSSEAWRSKTYLLTSIPLRKPRTISDSAPPQARPDEVFNRDIELAEVEVLEEDKGEEAEVDDAPDLWRHVRIVAVSTAEKSEMDLSLSEKAKKRRKWVVTPSRTVNDRTGIYM